MRIPNGEWPFHNQERIVRRFLFVPRRMIRREKGELSEMRWLEVAKWKQKAFVKSNGSDFWWTDLHWVD